MAKHGADVPILEKSIILKGEIDFGSSQIIQS